MADIKVRVGQSDAIKVLSTSMVSSGIVTTTQHAEVADYAKIAGVSTYASSAGVSTYASSAGIATYASSAGVSTYASSAGIATYASSAGVSTSVSGGTASVTQLNVVGVTTIGGTLTAGLIDGGSF